MIFNLSEQHSIATQFIFELRDKAIQQDRMRFRKNIERLGEILAYEISKTLTYREIEVETPLGKSSAHIPASQAVLLTILRAGLPFLQGFLNFFDNSDSGFVGAYRDESSGGVTVNIDYLSIPTVQDQVVIVIDPMLATGRSMVDSVRLILKKGTPSYLHIVSLIAAPEGMEHLKKELNILFRYGLV